MPTRTHAQALQLISAITAEIDFTFKDQLSYFGKRFRDNLQAQVNEAELLQKQQIDDLIYTYAQTEENGLIKQPEESVYNETLKRSIPIAINPTDLATLETEASAIITETEAVEIEVAPLVCPQCPRIALLSDSFLTLFAEILTPEIVYDEVIYASYDDDVEGTNGCNYFTPAPQTVYKIAANNKHYLYDNVTLDTNTLAPDGYYFTDNTTYYVMLAGLITDGPLTCDFG